MKRVYLQKTVSGFSGGDFEFLETTGNAYYEVEAQTFNLLGGESVKVHKVGIAGLQHSTGWMAQQYTAEVGLYYDSVLQTFGQRIIYDGTNSKINLFQVSEFHDWEFPDGILSDQLYWPKTSMIIGMTNKALVADIDNDLGEWYINMFVDYMPENS